MTSVFATGLPSYTTNADLTTFFSQYGEVAGVKLFHAHRAAMTRKGIINFADSAACQRCLVNQHPYFLDKRISLQPNRNLNFTIKSETGGAPYSTTSFGDGRQTSSTIGIASQYPAACAPTPPAPSQGTLGLAPYWNKFVGQPQPAISHSTSLNQDGPGFTNTWLEGPVISHVDPVQSEDSSSGVTFGELPLQYKLSVGNVKREPAPVKEEPVDEGGVSTLPVDSPPRPKRDAKERSDLLKGFRIPKKGNYTAQKETPRESVGRYQTEKRHKRTVDTEPPAKKRKEIAEEKSSDDDEDSLPVTPEVVKQKKKILKMLNTASAEKLTRLQLLGRKKADAIVTYRRLRGAFKSVDDMAKIPTLGPSFARKFKAANFIS